jgi:diguanylate cyclase (GGDEF)-like protein
MSINPLLNAQDIDGYIVQIQNITEEKKTKERILHISYHDQLTGLYNRRFYEEEKERLDVEKHTPLTLLMADLNGLKLTNDAFGHKAGDDLLIRAAKILKAACRTDDTVFRVGGDEFIIFMPKTNAENADKAIDRINKAIEKEASRNNLLSIAMGYSIKHNALDNIDDVYKKAEDEMYRHKLSISESIRSKTIDLIMKTLFEKNSREMEHSKRVSENSVAIAAKMNFNQERINQIKIAGLMHDIGKIGIDEKILEKPGKLEKYEWDEIQRHCEIGYRILSSVNEFSEIAGFILEHLERWDGKGYPMNLKGKDISIQARIICIADAFDAMISERPYRKAFTEQEAIDEIEKNAGTQFDSVIAKVFITKVLGRICA